MATVNWIFIDLNSYFASVEQETRPELRGQPIGILPQLCDNTVCIAASYQAKAYGVNTGTSIADAKILCPHIVFVEGRPRLYVEFHRKIVAAIERCIPVTHVMSCDEFACALIGRERNLSTAIDISYQVKRAIRSIGGTLRCSIGLAPNQLLAKVAAEMQKPDGLMVLQKKHLPQALFHLSPKDIPGIGERMDARLKGAGVTTMKQLCALSRDRMHGIWGSVLGDRMHLWLQGENFSVPVTERPKSIGHQHVLPPESRTREIACAIALKMLHSCAVQLRKLNMWSGGLSVFVKFHRPNSAFESHFRIEECRDTILLQDRFNRLWKECPNGTPFAVAVRLYNLTDAHNGELFDEDASTREKMMLAMDNVNKRFGNNTVYLGSIHSARDSAPVRVPFGVPPDIDEF